MKKSQLKNIIREVIKEQGLKRLDHDPERSQRQTPNSHHRFRIKWCTPHPAYGVGYEYTYSLYHPANPYNNGGLQCNGQMCQPGDVGKTYTGTFGPNSTPFLAGHEYELLWFDMPVNKNVFVNFTYQNDSCPSPPQGCDPSYWAGALASPPHPNPNVECRRCGLLFQPPGSPWGGGINGPYNPNDPSPHPNFATYGDTCQYLADNSCCPVYCDNSYQPNALGCISDHVFF